MSYRDYRGMVEESPVRTEIAEFRDKTGQSRGRFADRPAR